jgi:uncharacterized protein
MNQDLLAAAIIMAIGLIGTVIPLLPGPPLVWLGALYYAWRTNWTEVGWPVLILLLALALIGSTANTWMSYFGARKSGASLWSSLASIAGGLIGMMVLSLPGAIIGAVGAIAFVEYSLHRDWNKVLHAGKGYLAGYLLAMIVEVLVCLLMVGLFAAAVYF